MWHLIVIDAGNGVEVFVAVAFVHAADRLFGDATRHIVLNRHTFPANGVNVTIVASFSCIAEEGTCNQPNSAWAQFRSRYSIMSDVFLHHEARSLSQAGTNSLLRVFHLNQCRASVNHAPPIQHASS